MPKVLRIINRFNLGGPTYNAVYLTAMLSGGDSDEMTFETRLIGGSPAPGEAHSGYIANQLGVQYEEITAMSRSINPLADLRSLLRIIHIIREFRPDILHTHAAKAGALGRLAAWLCRVPVVVHTYHGHVFSGYFGSFKSFVVRTAEKLLGKVTTHVICISDKQFQEIVGHFRIVPPDKASVITLGFDLSRFTKDQEEKRTQFRIKYGLNSTEIAIGIIGRLAPIKNHALFISSFALAKKNNNRLRAFVIGDGETRAFILDQCKVHGLNVGTDQNSDVVFTSWIRNIEDALAGLDIVALTSINEGTPVSLIEAQASRRPVVTTDAGGVRDCVEHELTGLITDHNAYSISTAILRLADSEDLRKNMGEAGESFVSNKFSYFRLTKEVRSLYSSLFDTK
jgi:glycosyltransferase involved in cell wall biosynthesis